MSKPPKKPSAASAQPELEPRIAKLSFEAAIQELEDIIERMERGETGLEESLKEYAKGDQLIRRCRQVLDSAEQKIQAIAGEDLDEGGMPEGMNDVR